jgi:hypothetical protein
MQSHASLKSTTLDGVSVYLENVLLHPAVGLLFQLFLSFLDMTI